MDKMKLLNKVIPVFLIYLSGLETPCTYVKHLLHNHYRVFLS